MDETEIYELDHDLPALSSGEYTIKVTQEITNKQDPYVTEQRFFIAGERFHVRREEVGGIYPPKNGLGNYTKIAPHLVLNRSTLPWERQPQEPNADHAPWLTLLLFTENEIKASGGIKTIPLATLKGGTTLAQEYRWLHPSLDLEPGQADTDLVQVLDVSKANLNNKLPKNQNELKSSARVREVHQGLEKDAKAYLTSKGQIVEGEQYRVVLVSLENRYKEDSFDFQGATTSDRIRLVVLYSWSFTCSSEGKSLSDVVASLDRQRFVVPTNTLKKTGDSFQKALPLIQSGYSPVPHQMRPGGQSLSWYRGPLIPTTPSESDRFIAARSSDTWLRYHQEMGMIDVSYASAWDLGRLLALKNQHFSESLYLWKRAYVRNRHFHDQHSKLDTHHLKLKEASTEVPMPSAVEDFRTRLSNLEEVPFHYLVPQESMLPEQSIRFFQLDKLWVYALMDGALSIGRVASNSSGAERQMMEENLFHYKNPMTGFLIRSEVVSTWPELQIKGFGKNDAELTLIRKEKLGRQVLLCLFDGEVDQVDLYLDHSQMHFEWVNDQPVQLSGEGVRLSSS